MHSSPPIDGAMAEAPDCEQSTTVLAQEDTWARLHAQVTHVLPRLREIAVQVTIVGVLVMPIADSWSVRGGRGC